MLDRLTRPSFHPTLGLALFVSLTGMGALSAPTVRGSAEPAGQQIFLNRCAACHGAHGEGTKRYAKPLIGDKSVGQLATFIHQSMPPGPSRKWVGDDARKVAAYIHDAFYSPVARARNKPARIELSRLTVRQYRSAVADLIGSFRPAAAWDQRRGLHGEYFKLGRFRGDERLLERVDPEIRFDYGRSGPLPGQSDPYQFAMRWDGSVIAPDTGDYEFIVRSEHSVQLWVNDMQHPLIDAGVQSGSDTEFHGSLFLLGGRAYPLRLEFTKGVQGVEDLKKLKEKPPQKASLALEWKLPQRAAEVIPQRDLLPVALPETFALTAPFPPDDRSTGFERGTSVSKSWEDAITEAAIETAGYVTKHLGEMAGEGDGTLGGGRRGRRQAGGRPMASPAKQASDVEAHEARARDFCRRFVERAFRRPLTPDQERLYVTWQFQHAPDSETAVKRVVLLALQSPRFLYRGIHASQPDAYDVASRLSFGLWDSLPDEELLKAAAAGQLSTREQVARQAERMVADPRTRSKVREFLHQWLKVDQSPDLAKDTKLFPRFDEAVASDLRTSLDLFLDDVVWSERSDFRDLLLSEDVFLNGRLAKIYGVDLPPDAPFQKVRLDPTERAGVLTHPYLMASFAHVDTSSPIHRGVLLVRSVLGRTLQPPPAAFAPIPANLHPDMTTRQRVVLQTQPPACSSCHGMINPLGFALENFDAIGRYRTWENGKPIDASGGYAPPEGTPARFVGARPLARYLAGSEEVHAAFVRQLFQYMIKQPVRAFGPKALTNLTQAFVANDFNTRKELVEIMAASALAGSNEGAAPQSVASKQESIGPAEFTTETRRHGVPTGFNRR
jgi:hypothetical protein